MEFKAYRKAVPTRARLLTEQDYRERAGVIQTPEGIREFVPGDYLAQDARGEWPIKRETLEQYYTRLMPEARDGFGLYLRRGIRLAAQMPESFTIAGLTGKAGDYLVLADEGWPVDRELFEQTYLPVDEDDEEL